ncbi:MAG: hypothetical protein ACP6IT_05120 [Candidatus Thorarchaeota archaeon]
MSEPTIKEHSLIPTIALSTALCVAAVLVGYEIGRTVQPLGLSELVVVLLAYLAIPVVITTAAYAIGWYGKKRAVTYVAPTWVFRPTELTLDEAKSLAKEYPTANVRLVAYGRMWYFMVPPVLILLILAIPLYAADIDASLWSVAPAVYAASLGAATAIAVYGAFRATANDATNDFDLSFLRETIWLGGVQAQVPGLTRVRVGLEVAEFAGYRVFREPHVIATVQGIEEESRIQAWSEEVGALKRLLAYLATGHGHGRIVWSWHARDRDFWKTTGSGTSGYYVRPPVRTRAREMSVKDVELVTRNAVGLVALEWLRAHPDDTTVLDVLNRIGANPPAPS